MRRTVSGFFLLLFCLGFADWASAQDSIRDLVVKIHATHHSPDLLRPWTRMSPQQVKGSGVVIEPSTSERSYGPPAIALDASAKWAISTAPATASSSSSQSSRLSWQPSQEANLNTPSLGRLETFCPCCVTRSPLATEAYSQRVQSGFVSFVRFVWLN